MEKHRIKKTDRLIAMIANNWGRKAFICEEHGVFANSDGSNICPECNKECSEFKVDKL